jgi:hypothetical protein
VNSSFFCRKSEYNENAWIKQIFSKFFEEDMHMAVFNPKTKSIAQLQKTIDEKNAATVRYYDEIGRLYYSQFKNKSADVSKDINSRCEAVTALYADIDTCKVKILFENGLKLCAKCKKENPLDHAFCSACGAKFPEGSDVQPQ